MGSKLGPVRWKYTGERGSYAACSNWHSTSFLHTNWTLQAKADVSAKAKAGLCYICWPARSENEFSTGRLGCRSLIGTRD